MSIIRCMTKPMEKLIITKNTRLMKNQPTQKPSTKKQSTRKATILKLIIMPLIKRLHTDKFIIKNTLKITLIMKQLSMLSMSLFSMLQTITSHMNLPMITFKTNMKIPHIIMPMLSLFIPNTHMLSQSTLRLSMLSMLNMPMPSQITLSLFMPSTPNTPMPSKSTPNMRMTSQSTLSLFMLSMLNMPMPSLFMLSTPNMRMPNQSTLSLLMLNQSTLSNHTLSPTTKSQPNID